MTTTPARPRHFVLDITAANGTPFRVVAYAPGATGPFPAAALADAAQVEFYDRRYPFTEHGQFVARYFVDSLAGDHADGRRLDLYGGEPAWSVDAASMALIMRWLLTHTAAFAAS